MVSSECIGGEGGRFCLESVFWTFLGGNVPNKLHSFVLAGKRIPSVEKSFTSFSASIPFWNIFRVWEEGVSFWNLVFWTFLGGNATNTLQLFVLAGSAFWLEKKSFTNFSTHSNSGISPRPYLSNKFQVFTLILALLCMCNIV
jgi:hypothetical protein